MEEWGGTRGASRSDVTVCDDGRRRAKGAAVASGGVGTIGEPDEGEARTSAGLGVSTAVGRMKTRCSG